MSFLAFNHLPAPGKERLNSVWQKLPSGITDKFPQIQAALGQTPFGGNSGQPPFTATSVSPQLNGVPSSGMPDTSAINPQVPSVGGITQPQIGGTPGQFPFSPFLGGVRR